MCKSAACDYVDNLSHGSALEVLPKAKNGVWRVKLLIDPRQLEEILSKQVNTEALIEKMRMAAQLHVLLLLFLLQGAQAQLQVLRK